MKAKFSLIVIFIVSAICHKLGAQNFTLVKDIWPGNGNGATNSNETIAWNNKLYFTGRNGAAVNGNELYVSDGTEAGTYMVKDINPGSGAGGATVLSVLNNQLVFWGNNPDTGAEPYKSDGTEAGTVLIKDINPGTAGSHSFTYATFNGFRYFDGKTATEGSELWRTDGTEAGTTLVKDINTESAAASGSPRVITKVGNQLFFYAQSFATGEEIWVSDGTEAGTHMVKDIAPGIPGVQDGVEIAGFNGIAFFSKNDWVLGKELWRSDGTEAGTYMVKDINPGSGGSDAFNFIVFNNKLYFIAFDGVSTKLWQTDGTTGGTVSLVEAIGSIAMYGNNISLSMAILNGYLYFPGGDGANGYELWKTDGTIAGTSLVKDINPGPASSSFRDFFVVNDKILFNAATTANGSEPWITDGTAIGTYMLQDVEPGSGSSTAGPFTVAGNKLFSVRTTTVTGRELFIVNGFTVLPLQFLSFAAQKCNTNNVCLNWKTANEQSVSHFEIERSVDGRNFSSVDTKAAKNQSHNEYAATDNISTVKSQNLYYRIRQVDLDGSNKLTNIVSIKMGDGGISVYPTIVSASYHVQNNTGKKMYMQLTDAAGRKVLQQIITAGTNTVVTENLSKGLYYYSIHNAETKTLYNGKIIKL